MKIFKKFNYKDMLQVDGGFAVTHVNYGKAPTFNGTDSKNFAKKSRKNSLSSKEKIEDVIGCLRSFNGTEKCFKRNDQLLLWKNYWMEYVNAFDKLVDSLPCSVVTIFIGRQAIEIGFKYLLIKKNGQLKFKHDLGELSKLLFDQYEIDASYMEGIREFCKSYCEYIEGGNVEYFRYPEYTESTYFAGNRLDIEWLIYNFTLIILKLVHFADLESEFQNES